DSERPRGTRIRVSDIFFNMPARLKFMKSADWERRLIVRLIKTYGLICPKVAFYVTDADRELLSLPPVESSYHRVGMLLPKAVVDHLVEVDFQLGSTRITGLVSRPGLTVRHHLNYIYVNNRPVKYPRIYRALIEGYQNPRFPPAFLININVDPQFVDANIHPMKNEVRLKDERYILDLMLQVIKRAIRTTPVRIEHGVLPKAEDKGKMPTDFVQDVIIPYGEYEGVEAGRSTDEFWQLHGTYILAQTKSGLIIVDQHVAHERIIYESIMHGRVHSQRLLFPITVELTPEEHRVYERTKNMLVEMGIEFKEFSSRTVVIDSLPADARSNREEIAGLFSELNALGDLAKEKSEVARVIACRGAIKAGQRLSHMEMQTLIDRLFATANPYTCPHGRPIVLRWTIDELAHKFGRT
ncbi:MAG: hypothetical protein JSU64_04035, partial [candidate division WOR-3 bacterium]